MITGQSGYKTRFIDWALEHLARLRALCQIDTAKDPDFPKSPWEWMMVRDESIRCVIFSAMAVEAEAVVLFRLRGECALADLSDESERLRQLVLLRPKGKGLWCTWYKNQRPFLQEILQKLHIASYPEDAVEELMRQRGCAVHFIAGDLVEKSPGECELKLISPVDKVEELQKAENAYSTATRAIAAFSEAHKLLGAKPRDERSTFFRDLVNSEYRRRYGDTTLASQDSLGNGKCPLPRILRSQNAGTGIPDAP